MATDLSEAAALACPESKGVLMSFRKSSSEPKSEEIQRLIDSRLITRRTVNLVVSQDETRAYEWMDDDMPDEGTDDIAAWLENRRPPYDYS
jgi:hypothetical protein